MSSRSEAIDISERRGFLPASDPFETFETDGFGSETAAYLTEMDGTATQIPALLNAGTLRSEVQTLPEMPEGLVNDLTERACWRLCLVSGTLASAYVHDIDSGPVDAIPANVAVPLYETSRRLERKPILAYDLLCLRNFRRELDEGGFQVENVDTLLEFTTYEDERWFVAIHVAIEAAAGPALAAATRLHDGVERDSSETVTAALETIQESVTRQTQLMKRMDEHNDPEVFATEFRPYYDGFDGIVYEGVEELDGDPQSLRGGSGAQSLALPSIDAALGIDHSGTGLTGHLEDLRSYLPADHRAVVTAFEQGPDVRRYIDDSDATELVSAYNECVSAVAEFRTVHFGQTMAYIRRMTADSAGTGGTDYESFLRTLKMETASHRL